MIKLVLVGAVVVSLSLLVGCSSSYKTITSKDVRLSQSIVPLKIPAGLSTSKIKDYYPVPSGIKPADQEKVTFIPPGSGIVEKISQSNKPHGASSQVYLVNNSTLKISKSKQVVWQELVDHLHQQKIIILDKDQSLDSLYVMNKSFTNHNRKPAIITLHLQESTQPNQTFVVITDANNKPVKKAFYTILVQSVSNALS